MAITNLFVQPDLRRNRVTVTVFADAPGSVTAVIDGHGEPATGETNRPFAVEFPGFEAWKPGAARFYTLHTRVRSESGEESRSVAFAMREANIKDQKFVFNNHPQFLKALRLDPTAFREADCTTLFAEIVETGFNAIFVHADELSTALIDAADAAGLPIIATLQPENAIDFVLAQRNRACVVAWDLETPDATAFAASIRETDPTRLVFDFGAVVPRYMRPYRTEFMPMDRTIAAIDYPPTRAAENFLRNAGNASTFSLVEAGWTRSDTTASERFAASAPAEDSRHRHLASLAMRELHANAKLAGYILPHWCVELGAASPSRADNRPMVPVIQMHRTNLIPRQEAPVTVMLVNEDRIEGRADVSLQVVGPTNQVLWKKKRNVKIPRHARELWSGTVAASGSTGRHHVVVRVQGPTGLLAESAHPFDVFKPLDKTDQLVDLVGDVPEIAAKLEALGFGLAPSAPVIVVPKLANTVRAYPDNDLAQALGRAHSGAVALIFCPPRDWDELAELISDALWTGVHRVNPKADEVIRYSRLHPVFDGLPTRAILRREYAGVIGSSIGTGDSEEDICEGSLTTAGKDAIPARDILVRRYGSGRVVFVFFDLLEHLGHDPLADRLFDNLVRHFTRRSLPSEGAFPVHQRAVEWIRDQRTRRIRRWHLIGPFANSGGTGHSEAYRPEIEQDFAATYPGWYAAVFWKPYFGLHAEGVELPFDAFCREHHRVASEGDSGSYYAYSEVICDQRARARLTIDSEHAIACWFNRAEVLRSPDGTTLETPVAHETSVPLRQGRNTVLVKCSKTAGQARLRVSLTPLEEAVTLRWWN